MSILEFSGFLNFFDELDDIALFEVIEALEVDTTFSSLGSFIDIVLEVFQSLNFAWNRDISNEPKT